MKKEKNPEFSHRLMNVELEVIQPTDAQRSAGNTEPTLTLALSSETPVERYDFWDDKRYNEVLDHSAESVDLTYARDGLPLCLDHDTSKQVGILENVRIGPDRKIRGEPRFSRSQAGGDIERDVRDGIRKKVSVGYRIDTSKIEIRAGDKGEIDTHVIRRWTPMEASMVAVPADYSVGVGRSVGDALPPQVEAAIAVLRHHLPESLTAPKAMERTPMSGENAAPDNGAKPSVSVTERDEQLKADRQRSAEITALGRKYDIDGSTVDAWVSEGRDVNAVAATILAKLHENGSKGAPTGKPVVQLTEKERKNYSYTRAVIASCGREFERDMRIDAGFEREISQDLEKVTPSRHGGFMIPTFTDAESAREIMARQNNYYGTRAGLDSATSTKGSELKFTVPGEFLELVRNRMKTMEAGVTLMAGLQGPVAFPAQSGAGTASWVGENPGSDVADSNLTLAQISLSQKTVTSSTSYSRQLLAQSVIDVDSLVRNDLARIIAIELDRAVINGSGASNQPLGILGTSGIGSVAGGTNGLTPTYAHVVDLETQVTAASADLWPLSYMVHPTTRGTFKKAVPLANTVAQPVWQSEGNDQGRGSINGYPAFSSANVPNNLTKGTSSGICLAIICGAFSQAVVGDWGALEIVYDPLRLKKQAMVELTIFGFYGVAVKYPAAFAAMKDALA